MISCLYYGFFCFSYSCVRSMSFIKISKMESIHYIPINLTYHCSLSSYKYITTWTATRTKTRELRVGYIFSMVVKDIIALLVIGSSKNVAMQLSFAAAEILMCPRKDRQWESSLFSLLFFSVLEYGEIGCILLTSLWHFPKGFKSVRNS